MSDDVCGHPTAGGDGPPCQNPAGENGRCHIPSHNPDDDRENPGRPTKFNDERARRAIAAARLGKSKAGCARDAGVEDGGTIENWVQRNPTFTDKDGTEKNFFDAFRRARGDGETTYIREGRHPEGPVDPSFAKFMLASSYEYVKTERTEHDATEDALDLWKSSAQDDGGE